MALAVDTPRRERERFHQSYQAKNAEVFYGGSLVGLLLSTGRAEKWSDTAGLEFRGIARRGVTGLTSASPPREVEVDESGPVLERLAVTGLAGTVADVGKAVYATDDGTFTLTPTINVGPVGRVRRFLTSSYADVGILTPEEARVLTNGAMILQFPILLATIANGDLLTNYTPGFSGRITKFSAIVTQPATTAAKLATLNLEIGTTNLTGGSLALTSANMTPLGAVVDATAITAGNRFGVADTISIEAASVTTFIEGAIVLLITVVPD